MVYVHFLFLAIFTIPCFASSEPEVSGSLNHTRLNSLLTAEEAIKGDDFFHQNYIFSINKTYSLFLTRGFNQQEIALSYVDAHGNIEEKACINLEETETKKLSKAYILKDGIVVLQYYNPKQEFTGKFEEKIDAKSPLILTEEWVWDLLARDVVQSLFQIADSIVGEKAEKYQLTRIRGMSEFTNPEHVLIQDHSVPSGSSMRLYNLKTRTFYNGYVVPFIHGLSTIKVINNVNGSYNIPYSMPDHSKEYEYTADSYLNFCEDPSDCEDVCLNGKEHIYKFKSSEEESNNDYWYDHDDREGQPKGIRQPTLWKNSKKVYILPAEEVSQHRADISDVFCVDGAFVYKTNYERPEWHISERVAPSTKALIIYRLLNALADSSLNFFMDLSGNREKCLQNLNAVQEQLLERKSLFSEKQQRQIEGGARFLTSNFITQLFERFKRDVSIFERLAPVHTTSIKSLDGRFDFPVYYTLPRRKISEYFIVDVHGGPHEREVNDFSSLQQFFTSRGYPYYRFNSLGSDGFERELSDAIDGNHISIVGAVEALTNWVQRSIDGAKPIVLGGSFGGKASAAAYTLGKADIAISANGIFDLEEGFKSIAEGRSKLCGIDRDPSVTLTEHIDDAKHQYGMTEEIRHYNSVTTYLRDFTDQSVPHRTQPGHVFLFAGKKDTTHLCEHSEKLYQKLAKRGDAVELLTMADEGHTTSAPSLITFLRVLENYLGDLTGNPYQSNGYGDLLHAKGIIYKRANKR